MTPDSTIETHENVAGERHVPPPLTAPPHPTPQERPAAPLSAKPAPPGRARWLWLVVVVVICAGAYLFWSRNSAADDVSAKADAANRKGGPGAAIPVVATVVRKSDIGVYFSGLGAVSPIYTVTLKSRVDGEIMAVHYREGDIVQKGDLLIEIDPRPYEVQLEQYEGQLIRDQAILDNAKVDVARYKTLLDQNAIPEQQYATQQALVAQNEGVVKADQGQIDSARLNLQYCKITAPITGRAGLRLVDPGNIIHATDTTGLVVIAQVQPISVIFTISEDQLPTVREKLHSGQHLAVEAWDHDMTKKIAMGTLDTIDNEIDQTTGTVRLRAIFDNKDDALFPSQFINAKLLVQEKKDVVVVNSAGIQRSGTNTYVFLVKPDSTISLRNVTLGTTEGDQSEITSGLQPGDEIVMTGVDKLSEGTQVKAQIIGDQPAAAEASGAVAQHSAGKK